MLALEYFEAWVVLMKKKKDSHTRVRRLPQDPQVIKRLVYIRDVFFFGNTPAMALAANVTPTHLSKVLYGHSNLTVSMAAKFVQQLGVSAEWLICGSGSVFSVVAPHSDVFTAPKRVKGFRHARPPGVLLSLDIPTSLNAPWLNTADLLSDIVPPRSVPVGGLYAHAPTTSCSVFSRAAELIHGARKSLNSVSFFLAASSLFDGAADILQPLFSYEYADIAVFTLSAVAHDFLLSGLSDSFDVHVAAKQALQAGLGYGDVLSAQLRVRDDDSLLVRLSKKEFDFFVSAELGELAQHSAPIVCGAELGASVGAAAYTDVLSVTAFLQRREVRQRPVFVIFGEEERGVRFFLQRLHATTGCDAPAFIIFAEENDFLSEEIARYNGTVLFLGLPSLKNYKNFQEACVSIYCG